jgi:hypothetical protein
MLGAQGNPMSGSKQVLRWLFWACLLSSLVSAARTTTSRRRRKNDSRKLSASDTREVEESQCPGVTNSSSESGESDASCCHNEFCHIGQECETNWLFILSIVSPAGALMIAYAIRRRQMDAKADADIFNEQQVQARLATGIVASPMTMMQPQQVPGQMMVLVPEGVSPGQMMQVQTPEGQLMQVQVPADMQPGMQVILCIVRRT